jgi:hypothetical protein
MACAFFTAHIGYTFRKLEKPAFVDLEKQLELQTISDLVFNPWINLGSYTQANTLTYSSSIVSKIIRASKKVGVSLDEHILIEGIFGPEHLDEYINVLLEEGLSINRKSFLKLSDFTNLNSLAGYFANQEGLK